MDTTAVQHTAPPQERPSRGASSESPREDDTSQSEELQAVMNIFLAQIVQVVLKLLQRPEHTPTSKKDLDTFLRNELVAAIMGGSRQQPPSPQRDDNQQCHHPAEVRQQDGGSQ